MKHGADGTVLDVGRRRRTVPPAIRRAVERRDRGCRFPGCGLRICDAHHVIHWADGGKTSVGNVLFLCRTHHVLVHEGGFRVELSPTGEARFHAPDGRLLPAVPPRPRLPDDPAARLVSQDRAAGLSIDAWTATPDWHGERLDLGYAVWTLRRNSEPPATAGAA